MTEVMRVVDRRRHAWYPSVFDRVRVRDNYPGRMKIAGKVGTVEELRWSDEHSDPHVLVKLDDPGEYNEYVDMHPKFLVAQPVPPKFTTPEEADAWMDQQARQ